jgi:heme/copper-type cytochrome/quinol oxidase subunit 3
MRNKQITLFIVVAAIAFFGALVYNTMSYSKHRVEVCMEFAGKKNCRIAQGATKEAAVRMAIENACALISSGMTESMACTGTPPKSINWIDK